MKQEVFERQHAATWARFENWNAILVDRWRRNRLTQEERDEIGQLFPAVYREVCQHLAVARTRRYSTAIQQRLNQLALDGHQQLYRSRSSFFSSILRFLANDFPLAFRRQWRYMLVSSLLFYGPALGIAIAMYFNPDLIYTLLEPGEVARLEDMYRPDNFVLGRESQSDTNLFMFGYYIYNNISIGFRTFAGGLLFGLGSLFFLVFNGLFISAAATHLSLAGYSETFWTFVAGHSAFELTAITIFGGIGLMIGYAALVPGRMSRWRAIRDKAVEAMPLIYGGTLMLIAAAFIEAYWSSTVWPPGHFKFAIGGGLWLLTLAYFAFMGRRES